MSICGAISSKHAGMSSEKVCEKHTRRKFKVFKVNIIFFELVRAKIELKN